MPASPAANAPTKFLGSGELAAILGHIGPLGCLYIGARSGVVEDIRPPGKAASVYGFEPDERECARLNDGLKANGHPIGALRFLPVA